MATGLGFPALSLASAPCDHLAASNSWQGRLLPSARQSTSNLSRSARGFSTPSVCRNSLERKRGSVSVCTDPAGVDVVELSALLAATKQNCEQFPRLLDDGSVVPVDPTKLRRALRHSTVVVALYVGDDPIVEAHNYLEISPPAEGRPVRAWLNYWMPRRTGNQKLVAFGRATSDHALTASIYDLVVAPAHQRSGYGSQVLQKIVRDLRRRGICDIAAAPTPELRTFFQKSGFSSDMLDSTTMMYTRGPSSTAHESEIKEYGRKLFTIPPPIRLARRSPVS